MTSVPHLASLIHAQTSVFTRHAYEHKEHHNIADIAMLKDDIANLRHTLDEMEHELDEERNAQRQRGKN